MNFCENLPESLIDVCERLEAAAPQLDQQGSWPGEQLAWLADCDVYRWFIPAEYGGHEWSELQILEGYVALSRACLTTTFVLTQWNAACKRILGSENEILKRRLLPRMAAGELFATVGISHLSTSRQHIARPVLSATLKPDGQYELNGFSPWVTGAPHADELVLGASLEDGTQIICTVPTNAAGVTAHSGASLVALTSSCTDRVDLDRVVVTAEHIIAGPIEHVLQTNSGGGAGGLQTSTLAVGLSCSAARFLRNQAERRPDLLPIADKMDSDCRELFQVLTELTAGDESRCSASELRQRANSLVLRSTQAALTAAKGAGFLSSHPVGRWAREALFFLVWSCPQPVAAANLCELAQLASND